MIKNTEISKDDIYKIYKTIGKNVKKIRESKGVSQLNLAIAIGHKSVGVISNCELCLQNKHFNIEHLIKISDVLDVDIKDFFNDI
ncbi:helix-turn-helix domain-containing protein [Aliarcobacter cryaerophilus]|uniref:helix-turn-helix domain-containing protein n=1 Tax=Aliarcobacter cryaerophilus TaxID=28198 RepID=UPI0028CB715C|nr:helix-turn-helix transcriptional regulator [Aliarcobacter cryaerophilus]